jgi:hypothetical protein
MAYCYEKGIPHSVFLEWHPEDRAKTIAYAIEQSQRCNMCGTAEWEWKENRFAYTAVDEFCQGCYNKAMFSEQESNKTLAGTNVKLIPTTPIVKARMQVMAKRRRKRRAEEE